MKSRQRELREQQGQKGNRHQPGAFGKFENQSLHHQVFRLYQEKMVKRRELSRKIQEGE